MDFTLTEEQEMFRGALRDFVDSEIRPVARDWEHEGRYPTEIERKGAVMFGNEMIDEASRKMAEQVAARGKAAGLEVRKSWEEFKSEWEAG